MRWSTCPVCDHAIGVTDLVCKECGEEVIDSCCEQCGVSLTNDEDEGGMETYNLGPKLCTECMGDPENADYDA